MITVDDFLAEHGNTLSQEPHSYDEVPQHSAAQQSVDTTTDGQDELLDDSAIDACREAALRLLDAAPRSSGGLKQRLLEKDFAEPVVDEVIRRLQQVLLLDDDAYAASVLRYCLSRNMGPRYTERDMVRKGLDRDVAKRYVAEAEEQGLFIDAAYEMGRTVLKKTRGLDPLVRKRRLWSAGGRKGHSPDVIRQVAHDLCDQSDTD